MKPHRPQNTSLPVTGYFESFYLIGFSLSMPSRTRPPSGSEVIYFDASFSASALRRSSPPPSSSGSDINTDCVFEQVSPASHLPSEIFRSQSVLPSFLIICSQCLTHSLSLVFFLFCLLDVTGIKDSAFVPQTTAEAQSRRRTSSPRNEISFFIYRFQSLFCGIKSPLDGEERKIRKFLQSEAVECCKTYPNEESLRHEYVNLVLQTMIHHASLSFRIQFLIFHKLPPFSPPGAIHSRISVEHFWIEARRSEKVFNSELLSAFFSRKKCSNSSNRRAREGFCSAISVLD
jgi:hypothetical protein